MLRPVNNSEPPASQAAGTPEAEHGADREFGLRTVEPADGDAIHALLVASIAGVLGDRGRWLRRWHWRCWDNPYRRDRPAGWVLVEHDRVVGHLGAVYVPLRVGPDRKAGVVAADYAVDQTATARGGIFAGLELARAFFEAAGDTVCPMATTANEKTGAVFSRFGCQAVPWTRELWRAPVTLTQQIRTFHGVTSRVARRLLLSPAGALMTRLAGRFYQITHHRPGVPIPQGCWLETTVPQLAWDLGVLFERANAARVTAAADDSLLPVPFGIDRATDYLHWRYSRHPERDNIRVLMIRGREGRPIGGVVLFCEDRGTQRLVFVEDLIVLPDRPDVVRSLLCAALRLAADHQADFLVTTTGRCELRPLFWELGFESRARSAPAAVIRCQQASDNDQPPTLTLDDRLELWHGAMF